MEEILQQTTPPFEGGMTDEAEEAMNEPSFAPTPTDEPQEDVPPANEQTVPDYEAMAAEDLSEIRKAFPELRQLKSLTELHSLTRYAELREAGLSAVEAAAATQYERLRRPREDTRAHLSSSVPRHTSPTGGRISMGELSAARELFPSLSDREIEALYKRAAGSRPQ